MRKTTPHKIPHRLIAALLCLCMITSTLVGAGVMTAFAADTTHAAEPTDHIVAGTRVADPDTMDDYLNRLLTEASGSRYAGRVWTDKTVFAYGDGDDAGSAHFDGNNKISLEMDTDGYTGDVLFNADFGHVFSALASSQVINEYPPSPVDLVIVFDMSGSMGQDTRFGIDTGSNAYRAHDPAGDDAETWPDVGVPMAERIENSRVQKTLDAINQTIDAPMEQNPQNRVAVCGYGANAVVLMPLGHYQHVDEDGDGTPDPYLSVGGMETLYHPSDLVYRTAGDGLQKAGEPLPAVSKDEEGWYWMNNRDTCYTVVVNAEYNTYTGVLNENGDGTGRTDASEATDTWTPVQKTVSNNTLTDDGTKAKAFPGDWTADGEPTAAYAALSKTVYEGSSSDAGTWAGGAAGFTSGRQTLRNAFSGINAVGLEADDYVGYFTNTQGGIYLAYKQLADTSATTYTETLTNGMVSTVARIPAAIIMSDGGANFSFNEMGDVQDSYTQPDYTINDWNSRYGQRVTKYDPSASALDYIGDLSWWGEGRRRDVMHYLGEHDSISGNTGDEWYHVFLPGNDTLAHDAAPGAGDQGYWDGLHGIYNQGADIFEDGTLSTPPSWIHPGVLYSSDNNEASAPGVILEVLLTAAYMNDVVEEHYGNGWDTDHATQDSRVPLSTYTMNVDTEHVPQWGKMRLFPTLDPKEYPLDDIQSAKWYTEFGSSDLTDGSKNLTTLDDVYNELYNSWTQWKGGAKTAPLIWDSDGAHININPIGSSRSADYTTSITIRDGTTQEQVIEVTDADVIENIAYNNDFFDVTSEDLSSTFETILAEILGSVFVPISGDNDAGVGDSITYQDPLGEYMEIKDGAITATPHHIDEGAKNEGEPTTYDMSLLVFGEMHGLVRVGVYDYQWNDKYMRTHTEAGTHGEDPFPTGWYWGDDPETAVKAEKDNTGTDGTGSYPLHSVVDETKTYSNANEARADGWRFRVDFQTLTSFVPIVNAPADGLPNDLSPQVKNTKYTLYRFAGDQHDRNELHRNPVYGDVPEDLQKRWQDAYDEAEGQYPVSDAIYADTPGVYRLSDIRVWVEDTGDFTDSEGAIAPNQGYDRSLYLNIPVAAIPTELATITLGKDGVMAYQTNLGGDHPDGTDEGKDNYVSHEEYCYQSTPFRLFYAVGLEDDLILRDAAGDQVGVDTSLISPEYIQAHTDAATGDVWFISNYYSNTTYSGYTTDDTTRTRGDPTVTFSPGIDNRYYVFQKPLPLYAHAYRVSTDYAGPVDYNDPTFTWDSLEADGVTNSTTTWETYNGQEQQASSWVGGQFMGVYRTKEEFENAYRAWNDAGRTGMIQDSRGSYYEVVDGGVIFSEEDLLDHVTSTADGSGYEAGSHSFSSDDYYFILLEFYLPTDGAGFDQDGDPIDGASGGKFVQWALARKGSEFGSGYESGNIQNGDMLCWTDMNGLIDTNFTYLSKSDTGDRTRGEPTWEKLTYTESTPTTLRDYLKDDCGVEDKMIANPDYVSAEETPDEPEEINLLDREVAYWLARQADPQVIAALAAADADESSDVSEEEFKAYFRFALAARPGGIRSGDMSNNRQQKSTNTTSTAYNYYLPTISNNSGTDNNVIINNFLGNNGRLEIANETLHVTKMLEPPAGYTLTDAQKAEEFNFQVSIQGVTGTRSAVKTEYNAYAGSWERELAYIDVLTDNSDLVQTNDSIRALFVLETTGSTLEGGSVPIAKQVVQVDGVLYYANDDGTQGEEPLADQDATLYYLYLPANGDEDTDGAHVHRLYQNAEYDGADKDNFSNLEKNGTTTFVEKGQHEFTGTEPGAESRDSYREASAARPAGTKTYWAQDAELILKEEVDAIEGSNDILMGDPGEPGGIAAMALEAESGGGTWTHDDGDHGTHEALTFHTFVIRRPSETADSTTNFTSPYKTRTQYMTVTLEFGKNANANDGSGIPGNALAAADLYDAGTFGTVTNPARLLQITAEFTLQHGEGLMFSGLSGSDYKFAEQLTEDQLSKGYTLQKIEHVQQLSTEEITDSNAVSGDTGAGEEQVNYINTFAPGSLSITKKLEAQAGTTITDKDRESEFRFTLQIDPSKVGAPADGTYGYTVTDEAGKAIKTGRLLPHDVPAGLAPAQGENDLQAKEDGTWAFSLKGGETMTVTGLPTTSEFTYTVTETTAGDGYAVTDSDAEPRNTDKTVTGTVGPGYKDPVEVEFTNTKSKPLVN